MTDRGRIVDVRNVRKVYRRGRLEATALREVSFSVAPGEAVAVVGPSGSGKTTLLNLLAGLDRPTSGEVVVADVPVVRLGADAATVFRRRTIGFVFQFFNLLPTMSAADNVMLPLLADRVRRREAEARAVAMLAALGLAGRAAHRPSELSGGEQQRVAIARALVTRPRLLLADEPTGNLDSAAGAEVLAVLRRAVDERGLSIVMVTHSQAAAAAMDRVLEMHDGHMRTAEP
jgi:putative ABC transport system ATP-binding protein